MGRPTKFIFPAASANSIGLAQQRVGAGALIINGALLDQPATMQGVNRVILPGIERTISLTSAGNLSGVNFTITGRNLRGETISEVIAGPNANTVFTTDMFNTVTGISVSGTIGTDVTIGTGSTGVTNWYMSDMWRTPFNMTVAVEIVATANVTVQDTPADAQAAEPTTAEIFNHPTLAALTASSESNYAFPARYVRAVMNSSSGAGAFELTLAQAG